jgi:hypothetical protein
MIITIKGIGTCLVVIGIFMMLLGKQFKNK